MPRLFIIFLLKGTFALSLCADHPNPFAEAGRIIDSHQESSEVIWQSQKGHSYFVEATFAKSWVPWYSTARTGNGFQMGFTYDYWQEGLRFRIRELPPGMEAPKVWDGPADDSWVKGVEEKFNSVVRQGEVHRASHGVRLREIVKKLRPGDTLIIEPGVHKINTTLRLPSHVTIKGRDKTSKLLRTGNAIILFDITDCTDLEISNLTIDLNVKAKVTIGFKGDRVRGLKVSDVDFENSGDAKPGWIIAPVMARASHYVLVEDCAAINGQFKLDGGGGSTNIIARRIKTVSPCDWGISVVNAPSHHYVGKLPMALTRNVLVEDFAVENLFSSGGVYLGGDYGDRHYKVVQRSENFTVRDINITGTGSELVLNLDHGHPMKVYATAIFVSFGAAGFTGLSITDVDIDVHPSEGREYGPRYGLNMGSRARGGYGDYITVEGFRARAMFLHDGILLRGGTDHVTLKDIYIDNANRGVALQSGIVRKNVFAWSKDYQPVRDVTLENITVFNRSKLAQKGVSIIARNAAEAVVKASDITVNNRDMSKSRLLSLSSQPTVD